MIPVSISLTNFGPFRAKQTFQFPREPGLYFLWGDNQEQPRLGPNGAGKTKLFDALAWVLFGKTTRGLKAGDAANWDAGKGTVVEFEYISDGGFPFLATRTWAPNSWTLTELHDGTVHDLAKDSNPLLAELGLDFTPFLNAVMMAQGQPMFLDIKAEAKAALFSEVMGLDRWLDYSQKASRKASEWDAACRRLEREIASFDGQLEQLNTDDLEARHQEWLRKQKQALRELADDHARLVELSSRKGKAIKEAEVGAGAARALYAVYQEKAENYAKDHPDKCPECGHERDNIYAPDLKQRLRAIDEAEALAKALRRERDTIEKTLDQLEATAEKKENEASPFLDMLERVEQAREQTKQRRSRARRELEDADAQSQLNSYWVKWFKEIRLHLIGETLAQLEIEVNSCVNGLGLIGWELRFEVDRESKTGSIQRGFNVFVQSPHNTRLVPWEAWSGGESQRLRIATQQGLGNLIRERVGSTFTLEVWDEPTQWMGGSGVDDLLDSLAERAKTEGRQIWLIDHRSLGYGAFDGTSGVIKTKKAGSVFDQSGLYISPHAQQSQPPDADGPAPHDDVRHRTSSPRTERKALK